MAADELRGRVSRKLCIGIEGDHITHFRQDRQVAHLHWKCSKVPRSSWFRSSSLPRFAPSPSSGLPPGCKSGDGGACRRVNGLPRCTVHLSPSINGRTVPPVRRAGPRDGRNPGDPSTGRKEDSGAGWLGIEFPGRGLSHGLALRSTTAWEPRPWSRNHPGMPSEKSSFGSARGGLEKRSGCGRNPWPPGSPAALPIATRRRPEYGAPTCTRPEYNAERDQLDGER